MRKLIYLLHKFDGIWSIPLAFLVFWLVGILMETLFGYTTAVYDISFMQPLFLASGIVIGAVNVTILGMWFNFRGIHRFIWGYKNSDGMIINKSKDQWEKLTPIEQLRISLWVFFLLFFAIVSVYLKLV